MQGEGAQGSQVCGGEGGKGRGLCWWQVERGGGKGRSVMEEGGEDCLQLACSVTEFSKQEGFLTTCQTAVLISSAPQ